MPACTWRHVSWPLSHLYLPVAQSFLSSPWSLLSIAVSHSGVWSRIVEWNHLSATSSDPSGDLSSDVSFLAPSRCGFLLDLSGSHLGCCLCHCLSLVSIALALCDRLECSSQSAEWEVVGCSWWDSSSWRKSVKIERHWRPTLNRFLTHWNLFLLVWTIIKINTNFVFPPCYLLPRKWQIARPSQQFCSG